MLFLFSTRTLISSTPFYMAMNCNCVTFLFFSFFFFFKNLIPAKDIRMIPDTTAEEILQESLDVAQTNGEWELLNIEVVPVTLDITDGNYSQIRYNVSTCSTLYEVKIYIIF